MKRPALSALRLGLGFRLWNRRIRFTRDGVFFLAVTLSIGLAALNTGHNLFYLVFAMLVSLLIVSGLLSERALKSLRIERRLPLEAFARAPAAVEVRLRNASRRRTSYAVEVHDEVEGQERRRIGFVERLDPGSERAFHAVWTFGRRGRHRFGALHLVTRFPFGLVEKTRIVPIPDEIVVLPSVERRSRDLVADLNRDAIRKNRLGEDVLSLRPKLPEDDSRRIHWRISARVGELVVKEHGEARDRPVAVFFDDRGPAGPAFEAAVERAAALLWQIQREGRPASLYGHGVSFRAVMGESLRQALRFLAEVEPAAAAAGLGFLEWRAEVMQSGGGVYVTAGDPPELPPGAIVRVA